MSFFEALYQLIIGPLKILMEVIYGAAYNLLGSEGGAIIPLSLTLNLLMLPLYLQAENIQNEERQIQKKMEPVLAQIKAAFHGDERYMMQQAYYRINHYKPLYTLRSALPLFLQVPFFMAALQMLSSLPIFEGRPFGLILDLSKPDGMLSIGGHSLNLLPILMTMINMLSSEIYAKDLGWKDRVRMHAMALVFLVILYGSPSGLVFYWTLNNLFSLVKNIVRKSKHPQLTRNVVFSSLGTAVLLYGLFLFDGDLLKRMIFVFLFLCFQIPSLGTLLGKGIQKTKNWASPLPPNGKLFFSGCLLLAILTGIMIPASVISDSPSEFILYADFPSPLLYVLQAFLLALGCFVLWFGLVYFLCSRKARYLLDTAVWVLCGCSLLNYMLFGTNLGMLSPQLEFGADRYFSVLSTVINAEAILAMTVAVILLSLKKQKLLTIAAPILILAVAVVSGQEVWSIHSQMPQIRAALDRSASENRSIQLSRRGKNVIVLMMDSQISSFVPYILQEKPELMDQFDGFTWYPNTLSYGPATNTGIPGVFGGYEYIPEEMNRRDDLPLVKKQNEALRLMPVLFDNAGYMVTVCDPTYANYCDIPDVTIYADHPNITAFNIRNDQIDNLFPEMKESQLRTWKRNFFCYGLMKVSPILVQDFLYEDGTYFNPDRFNEQQFLLQFSEGLSKSTGVVQKFVQAYEAMGRIVELTQVVDTDQNAFFIGTNCTPHDPTLLQTPDYIPQYSVDNTEYDAALGDRFSWNGQEMTVNTIEQMKTYHVNMAAMIQLGKWFDKLRAEGVYDNTRIIIVADHGRTLHCFDNMWFGDEPYEDAMRYNPVLLVKDFNAHGFTQDDSFMTNADTPLLALEGLIENPVNPATGKPLSNELKNAEEQHVFFTYDWQVNSNNGNTFLPGIWLALKNQNVLDKDNWTVIGEK